MKALSIVAAFLGGVTLGAAAGILFAPEKGEDTRRKIAEVLRKKGIRLNRAEGQTFELITMNEDGTITFKQQGN